MLCSTGWLGTFWQEEVYRRKIAGRFCLHTGAWSLHRAHIRLRILQPSPHTEMSAVRRATSYTVTTLFYFEMIKMLFLFLGLLALQRGGELLLAKRNERFMKAEGAYEVGAGHYRWIVLMHIGWFVSMIAEYLFVRPEASPVWPLLLGVFLLMQCLRYYVITTLGRYWNTRIIILPGARRIQRGLYKYINHPNYWIVRVELLVVPLIFQLYTTAVVFSLLNFFLLQHRIRIENEALSQLRS